MLGKRRRLCYLRLKGLRGCADWGRETRPGPHQAGLHLSERKHALSGLSVPHSRALVLSTVVCGGPCPDPLSVARTRGSSSLGPAQHLPQEGLPDTVEWNVPRIWNRPGFSLSWAGRLHSRPGHQDPEATLGPDRENSGEWGSGTPAKAGSRQQHLAAVCRGELGNSFPSQPACFPLGAAC